MPVTRSAPTLHCDLLVAGSGAGGLAAAVTAARLGLKVLVVEKQARFGGTTAWSGGWMWVPRHALAVAAGIQEDIAAPLAYLRHELGPQFDETRARAYLEQAPRMVDFFRSQTALQFVDGNTIPDFHGNSPGAATGGRSLCAAPFDARRLGAHLKQLQPPLWEMTLWGMGIASADLRHFLQATRSWPSFKRVAGLLLRHAVDLALHGRSQRLVNGHALVGALAASALEAGAEIRVSHPLRRLLLSGGRVTGAVVDTPGGEVHVHSTRGVVLACGGFPHDLARKRALLPHAPTGREHWSAAAWGNTGDGLRLGESAGGVVARHLAQAAALAPVSLVPRAEGSVAHFPHLVERGKPGLLAVTRAGRRFTNEADPYHDFIQGLLKATPAGQAPEAWLVCDHRFIRRYGLGAVKPAPLPLGRWLRNGYLQRASTLNDLAQQCGMAPAGLQATVQRFNQQAQTGQDSDFAKGQTPYNRMQGDASAGHVNPCMAPLQQAPFYAVKVLPGSLGTFAGLQVNKQAQVLDAADQAISGLYAVGNDMASIMGGHYPSGGITLGPAMTYGFLAAEHAAGRSPSAAETAFFTHPTGDHRCTTNSPP